jgi:hypothetical protein
VSDAIIYIEIPFERWRCHGNLCAALQSPQQPRFASGLKLVAACCIALQFAMYPGQ